MKGKAPDEFDEYICQGEPSRRAKGYAWKTAIGLQAVDGLQTSDYLVQTARRHIEGEISIEDAQACIRSYYETRSHRAAAGAGTEEADKVSANIAQILGGQTLSFSVAGLVAIHRRLFEGVFDFAGTLRTTDITKREWVLRGDTVLYVSHTELEAAISYDLEQEKRFVYAGLAPAQVAGHIAQFVSKLWQIHPFREGNTRTTAVFAILYLRSLGFAVENDLFANHSWYFRNALVRANYQNVQKGIDRDPAYLERFFRNLLMGEANELKNRSMLVPETIQAPYKHHTSAPSCPEPLRHLAKGPLGVRELMERAGLKNRAHFLTRYIAPALRNGLIEPIHPESPHHPRQKYRLTDRGLAMLAARSI